MCAKGWHIKRFNPAGVKIKVYEMPHEPDRFSPRGGPNTGELDSMLLTMLHLLNFHRRPRRYPGTVLAERFDIEGCRRQR